MVHYIPEGTRAVTPHLVLKGAAKAIEFYKAAFGAVEHYHMPGPGGSIGHAELQIADSLLYLADEFPQGGGGGRAPRGSSSVVLHMYVPDADATCARAVAAGAKVTMPMMDAFWGDRYGQVTDPFGHVWSIATHKQDLTPEQMMKAMAAMPPPKPAKRAAKRKPSPRKARTGKAKGRKAGRKRR